MMNHFADIATHPHVGRLGWTLIHFVWQATLVAFIVAVALRFTERRRANSRYIGLCVALLMLTVAPVVTFVMLPTSLSGDANKANDVMTKARNSPTANDDDTRISQAEVTAIDEQRAVNGSSSASSNAEVAATAPVMPSRTSSSSTLQSSGDSTTHTNPSSVAASTSDGDATTPPRTSSVQSRINAASPWIVACWIVGVLLLSVWHFFGWVLVHRLKTRATSPVAGEHLAVLASLKDRMGIRTAVQMLESAATTVPLVVGWFRPVLLMPASVLTGLPPEQFEAILAHELAHVRRHDFLVNVLQTIVETCLFYHPAVWWLSRRIRIQREFCADDEAAAVCESRECYARALVSLADSVTAIPQPALAASGGALTQRVYRLLGLSMKRDRFIHRPAWLISAMMGMGLVCALFASTRSDAQPPQAKKLAFQPEPIGTVAKHMDGAVRDWKLQNFDEKPTVNVAGHRGYKVVLRRTWKVFTNPPQQQIASPTADPGPFILKHVDWEFVLFPTRPDQPPGNLKSKIAWQKSTSPYHTRNIYLGEGFGYSWFTHGTIVWQDALREKLRLTGGDGRIQLAADGLGMEDEDESGMTARSCIYILAKFGDDALPFIERAIEANKKKPSYAVRALTLHRTPEATRILTRLAASEDAAIHRPADYVLINEPFRKEAKSAYIRMVQRRDYLDYAGRACVQFGWKDAIPALEEVIAKPKHWQQYHQALTAKRALEGKPIPDTFEEAEQFLIGVGRASTAMDLKRQADARLLLVNSTDNEPAILSGIRLALFVTKGDVRAVNAEGVRILVARPRKPTVAFLRSLAARCELKYRKQLDDLANQVEDSHETTSTEQGPPTQTIQQGQPKPLTPRTRAPRTTSQRSTPDPFDSDDSAADQIAWGKTVNGLRTGIAFVSDPFQERADRVRVGESVSVELIVKNVSGAPIQFSTVSPSFRVPTVVDANGKKVRVTTPVYDGPASILKQKLKPGESVKLPVHDCSVAPRFPYFSSDSYHVLAGTGKYRLSVPLGLSKFNDGDWVGKLETGSIELEVLPADKKWLTQQVSAKLKQRAKNFTCKVFYVGLPQNRLRSAGLMSQSSDEQFPSHWSTTKIDANQANAIIDFLAKEGHLWRQVAEPLPTDETPMVSYFVSIDAGRGALNNMMIQLPWSTMAATIRDIQQTVSGDASRVLATVLDQPLLSGWHQLVSGKMLGVSVERALYERDGHPHFYMKFRLTNRTRNDVFVDLDKYNRIFSPNQWGIHREPERTIVDESRMIPLKLTPAQRNDLIARAKAKKLTRIPPGESIDYFHDFNRSGRKDVEAQQKNGKYFIASIDGQLFATDGKKIDSIDLEWTNQNAATMNTEVAIPAPVTFQKIPADAKVIAP